jgi:hypothetical protein
VVAVARMLVIDAGGDSAKMGFLLAKFLRLLTDTIEEMFNDPNEGRLH